MASDFCDWEEFCVSRFEYLMILAETVEQGFTRRDTKHPHSAGVLIGIRVFMARMRC